jgi:hypothetical protein
MRFFGFLVSIAAFYSGVNAVSQSSDELCNVKQRVLSGPNNCIQFSVTSGTGCAWMCNYCANQLGTNNYYFTDNVCTYQEGQGCVGNPVAGKSYTCCSV